MDVCNNSVSYQEPTCCTNRCIAGEPSVTADGHAACSMCRGVHLTTPFFLLIPGGRYLQPAFCAKGDHVSISVSSIIEHHQNEENRSTFWWTKPHSRQHFSALCVAG